MNYLGCIGYRSAQVFFLIQLIIVDHLEIKDSLECFFAIKLIHIKLILFKNTWHKVLKTIVRIIDYN